MGIIKKQKNKIKLHNNNTKKSIWVAIQVKTTTKEDQKKPSTAENQSNLSRKLVKKLLKNPLNQREKLSKNTEKISKFQELLQKLKKRRDFHLKNTLNKKSLSLNACIESE